MQKKIKIQQLTWEKMCLSAPETGYRISYDNKQLGRITLQLVDKQKYEITYFEIDEDLRGQGFSKLVLRQLIVEADSMSVTLILTAMSFCADQLSAKHVVCIYQKHGFEIVSDPSGSAIHPEEIPMIRYPAEQNSAANCGTSFIFDQEKP